MVKKNKNSREINLNTLKNEDTTVVTTKKGTISKISLVFDTELLKCEQNKSYGRHFVAKEKISRCSIILKEKWLFSGPHFKSSRVCIGCHSKLSKKSPIIKCQGCDWFICNPACGSSSPFHNSSECDFLSINSIKPPEEYNGMDFGALTVLRGLMLKIKDEENWKKLNMLQHHNHLRKELSVWKENKQMAELICKKWSLNKYFTPDEVFNICGIIEVNGFEMGDAFSFGGICLKASMISHSCLPNAAQNENIEEGCLEVVAISDIEPGEPITVSYDGSLEGTLFRRKLLSNSKYFTCTCTRCEDPAELSTNFSTLICNNCHKGFITENKTSENNNKDGDLETLNWACDKCTFRMSSQNVEKLCMEYKQKSSSLDGSIGVLENFLVECKTVFHSNHFIPTQIKFKLCMAYGRDDGFLLGDLDSSQIARKLELCKNVLDIFNLISPGLSVGRGNVLYEMQAAQAISARYCLASGKCSKSLIKKRLQQSLKILQESIQIFKIHYPMRLLAQEAENETEKELRNWISTM